MSDAMQQLDRTGRAIAPAVLTLALVLVGVLPIQPFGTSAVAPQIALASVYYWAIHRPDLLRPSLAFLIGLLIDLLSRQPFGLTALVHVLMYWALASQRRMLVRGNLLALWIGFALVCLLSGILMWAAVSILSLGVVPFLPLMLQVLVSAAFFPLVAGLCMRVHRALPAHA